PCAGTVIAVGPVVTKRIDGEDEELAQMAPIAPTQSLQELLPVVAHDALAAIANWVGVVYLKKCRTESRSNQHVFPVLRRLPKEVTHHPQRVVWVPAHVWQPVGPIPRTVGPSTPQPTAHNTWYKDQGKGFPLDPNLVLYVRPQRWYGPVEFVPL